MLQKIHPRVYGADTKLLKKISEIAEHPLLPQNPMIESVCIIFLKYIFADNTFWLFSMFFCKKRDAGCTSFLVCFLVMTFFFLSALFQDFTLYLLFLLFLLHIRYGVTVSGEGSILRMKKPGPVWTRSGGKVRKR